MIAVSPFLTRRATVLLLATLLGGVLGCGGNKHPKTHTITGKVEVQGGQAAHLAGSHVEAVLTGDPYIRASGVIDEEGRFTLETLHAGSVLKGAQEGAYQARIILTDDDPKARRQAKAAVDERFLKFDTAALSFEVPSNEEIVLRLTPR